MRFDPPLIPAVIRRRYKRFLADVELADGRAVTVHCPNSGSMLGCWADGWEVRLSDHPGKKRKYRYTLEMTHNGNGWIGVNTMLPNQLVREALEADRIPSLRGLDDLRSEVPYGESSRIDLLKVPAAGPECYIEVKNVTLVDAAGRYCFPDAPTVRGRKHLVELQACVAAGFRAVLIFTIQRSDGAGFRPAAAVDPAYAAELQRAAAAGVEILALRAAVSPTEVVLTGAAEPVDLELDIADS